MKSRFAVLLVLVVIAALAVTGYFMSKNAAAPAAPVTPSSSGEATSTDGGTDASSAVPATTSPSLAIPLPDGSSSADLSAWTQYSNPAKGYSLSYPADLIRATETDGSVSLSFPKNVYFHWPLLDDATITIAVGPTCPAITAAGLGGDVRPESFTLNGQIWKRTMGIGAAAGNRYEEIAYDLAQNGTCYHIGFLDHGANGSGLYVDDASLIAKYDATHDTDLQTVILILNTIVGTFKASGLKG